MLDYVHALLAMQEEAESDRPEDLGPDAEHTRKLAQARTELLLRQRAAQRGTRRPKEQDRP
jgi:hypothetical protein